MISFSDKTILKTIGIIGIGKIIFLFVFIHQVFLWEAHYIALGLLADGEFYLISDGIKNYTEQFPVFAYLVFQCYKLFGVSPYPVIVLNILISSFTGYFLYRVLQYFFDECNFPEKIRKYKSPITQLSLLLFLFHPLINYYTLYNVHPFALDLFLLILPLYLMSRWFEKPGSLNFVVYSLVLGLTILNRATLIVAIVPFFILLWRRYNLWKSIRLCSVIMFISFFVVLPWLIRNYQKDHIIGLISGTEKLLWKGSLAEADGSNYLLNGKNCYELFTVEEQRIMKSLPVREQDAFFMKKYSEIVKDKPAQLMKLYLRKLNNFWLFRKQIGNEYSEKVQKFIPLYKVIYLIILFLCTFLFVIFPKKLFPLLSVPIALSLLHSVFYVETRHRVLIEPILIFGAIISIFFLLELVKVKFFLKKGELVTHLF